MKNKLITEEFSFLVGKMYLVREKIFISLIIFKKLGKEVLTESLLAIFQEPPKESAAITLVIKTL